MITRLICIVIGYVFGLFQTGYVIGKMNGIDIRNHGSGNAGTTNTLRTLGTKAGLITLVGDAFKCVFAIIATRLIFRNSCGDILPLLAVYTAAGVILGHNFPFYLNFKGGKGIAATAGLILAIHPIVLACELTIFLLIFFTTHYVSLGSICVYVGLVIEMIVLGQMGQFGMDQVHLTEMYIVLVLLAGMAITKHRSNIQRLLKGNERKTYLTKKSDK